ncbi:MAG TPA: glucose-6-phosphate dehydrogenase [Candidatus Moranbacteria bacterium]|nr:glucose-6-phosphate dehydrogenase [Candidatus Moranbacteria bacterium]
MKNRKLNRLNSYDYSQQGMYFITICTKNREEFFGEIKNTEMVLNDVGKIILKNLNNVSNYSPSVFLDENIIMPNHVHLIIEIIGNVGADLVSAQNKKIQIKNSGQT